MKKNKLTLSVLILVILIATTLSFSGCIGENPIIPPSPEPNTTGTTRVLEEATIQELVSLTGDQSTTTLLFENPTPQIEELAVGDIIVMGVTEHTPEGLLRRVKNINRGEGDDNRVLVDTEFASLVEAIGEGEFNIEVELKAEDAEEPVCYVEGIKFIRDKSTIKDSKADLLEFTYHINTIIYDGDHNPDTEIDNITLTGEISFDYKLVLTGDAGLKGCPFHCHFYLKEFKFENIVDVKTDLGVIVGGSIESFSKEKKLWEQDLGLKTFWIAEVPVVLHPIITIVANVEGGVFAEITADIINKDTFTAGLKLKDGSWNEISSHTHNYSPPSLSLSAGGEATFGVGPKLECKVYGVLGPYAETNLYGKAVADIYDNPWWKLYGGILAKAGVKIEIFDKTYASAEKTILDKKLKIAQANGPF